MGLGIHVVDDTGHPFDVSDQLRYEAPFGVIPGRAADRNHSVRRVDLGFYGAG